MNYTLILFTLFSHLPFFLHIPDLASQQHNVSIETYKISPIIHVKKGAPPTILFLGTDDKLVPLITAQ